MTALTCLSCGTDLAGRTHAALKGIVSYSLCYHCSRRNGPLEA